MDSLLWLLLALEKTVELVEGDHLVGIDVDSANDGDDLGLRRTVTVHATEIHDVVIVEDAFTSIVNCLERFHVRPINSPLQIVLDLFHVHVILDFVLEQECNLLFDRES